MRALGASPFSQRPARRRARGSIVLSRLAFSQPQGQERVSREVPQTAQGPWAPTEPIGFSNMISIFCLHTRRDAMLGWRWISK